MSLGRVIGGAMMIAAELTRPVNFNLYIGAFILEAAGLSPLLLATSVFLGIVYATYDNFGLSTKLINII